MEISSKSREKHMRLEHAQIREEKAKAGGGGAIVRKDKSVSEAAKHTLQG